MKIKELFGHNKEFKVQGGCLHLTDDLLVFNSYVDGMLMGIPVDDIADASMGFKGRGIIVKLTNGYMYTWFLLGGNPAELCEH